MHAPNRGQVIANYITKTALTLLLVHKIQDILTSSLDVESELTSWSDNTYHVINSILQSRPDSEIRLELINYYFFHRIQSTQNLVCILKSRTILEKLGLSEHLINEKITTTSTYLLSFMLSPTSELGTFVSPFISDLLKANCIQI